MKKIKNCEQLYLFITGLTESHVEDAIILYHLGNYYVAIAEAAVTLFKLFGWDFKETHGLDNESDKVFCLVTHDGVACLIRHHIKTVVRETKFILSADCASMYTNTQQFLEYLRSHLNEGESFNYPFIRESVVFNTADYQRVARLTSLSITNDSIRADLDNKDSIVLAANMVWDFKKESIAIMRALHNIISKQHDLMVAYARDRDMTEKEVRRRNTFILQLTEFYKISHAGEVVLVKQRGFFISFDDDAIIIADRLSVPLYECRTFGTRNHTAVVITANEFMALTDMDVNIHCIATKSVRDMYEFGLTYNVILNFTYDKSIIFDDVAVMKEVDGNYIVKASYGEIKFEPVIIPNQTGMYLCSLGISSLEYCQMLACIVHQVFDERAIAIKQQLQNEDEQT